MQFEPRAIVTESLDSKQSNMAFDWLMGLVAEGCKQLSLIDYGPNKSLEHWVLAELGLGEGGLEWFIDPTTRAEYLIIGLGNDLQVCYSRQLFHRQSQIMFAAPTAADVDCQVGYWSRHLIELYDLYQDNLRNAA